MDIEVDTQAILTAFRVAGIPERRAAWIGRELRAEIETAVMRVVAAHQDVAFWIDGEPLDPDQRASVTTLLSDAAMQGGAVDGRSTDEIAAAVGLPRRGAETYLSHPKSRLEQHPDGRWYPQDDPT